MVLTSSHWPLHCCCVSAGCGALIVTALETVAADPGGYDVMRGRGSDGFDLLDIRSVIVPDLRGPLEWMALERRDGEPTQLSHLGLHCEHRFPAPCSKDEGCRKPVLGVCVWVISGLRHAMQPCQKYLLQFWFCSLQKSYESCGSVCVRVCEVPVRNQKIRSADNDFSELCEAHLNDQNEVCMMWTVERLEWKWRRNELWENVCDRLKCIKACKNCERSILCMHHQT